MSIFYTACIQCFAYICGIDMNRFEVIQPSEWLVPYVKQYWFLTLKNIDQGSQRLIPFDCVTITFNQIQSAGYGLVNGTAPRSRIFGQTNQYLDLSYSEMADFITVVFTPAGANAFFDRPMHEFINQHPTLESIGDPVLMELENQLMETSDTATSVHLIEALLRNRICKYEYDNYKRLSAVIQSIENGQNNLTELAKTACLSYKQFKRIFTEHIGINPKEFVEIDRFQKTLLTLQTSPKMSLRQVADQCGYYDKSHLIKELRKYIGFTPNEFLSSCDEVYSEYHSLFRSAFVDLPTHI